MNDESEHHGLSRDKTMDEERKLCVSWLKFAVAEGVLGSEEIMSPSSGRAIIRAAERSGLLDGMAAADAVCILFYYSGLMHGFAVNKVIGFS